jgi:hypothetical protein
MTAQDIPAALARDVSHAKRTLRTPEATHFLRDAYRLEAQSRRPRKRLLAWLQSLILPPMPLPVSPSPSLPISAAGVSQSKKGGPRPGAGRPTADYARKTISIELPQPLIDQWDKAAEKHGSRAKALAHLLKWKWPK